VPRRPGPLPDLLPPPRKARPWWLRGLYLAGAGVCFLLGIAGWLVPVVTGIPFYVAALALLGMASDRTRRWVNAAERRLPERWRRGLRRALLRTR
jgi:uncharacterized membrane protein YbaN (DUF454 family)